MKSAILTIVICFLIFEVNAQSASRVRKPARLQVSADKRNLVHQDGSPFFWLADTGWELFHRLDSNDVNQYLSKRAAQGFTLIQAVALAELDGLHTPNRYGATPLENDDPLRPKEEYFRYVDWVIDRAASYGMYIGLLPTWGDKLFKNRWGAGPEIFNEINARQYGKWIGDRYKDKTNIVWILGGDRLPRNDTDVNVWRAMAAGVIEGVGNKDKALLTYHPQPSATSSSSPWFHNDDWLDFNMLQTGHCRDIKVWELIQKDYNLKPVKPTLNGEPIYEDHPVCFNAKELGYTNSYDIRKAAYLSVFAGSAGFTYGCHAVWQFHTPPQPGVNGPLKSWQASLDLPAASQMKHLKNFMSNYGKSARPAEEILTDTLDGTKRIQAMRTNNHILVYSAGGEPFSLQPQQVNLKKSTRGFWYNPRAGTKQKLDQNTILQNKFTPPSNGEGNDWVLLLSEQGFKD